MAFAKLHVFVNSTQRKIIKQVNQHLTLFHTDILTFTLKSCYNCLIPMMEKYNFTLPAFWFIFFKMFVRVLVSFKSPHCQGKG
jgi:hypothetical protein